jgi:hypothetical protein
MDATVDALPPGMVRSFSGFWPWRVLYRRRSLLIYRPSVGQENWTVRNAKLDHPVSPKTVGVPGHQHKQGASKDGSFADRSGGSQGRGAGL